MIPLKTNNKTLLQDRTRYIFRPTLVLAIIYYVQMLVFSTQVKLLKCYNYIYLCTSLFQYLFILLRCRKLKFKMQFYYLRKESRINWKRSWENRVWKSELRCLLYMCFSMCAFLCLNVYWMNNKIEYRNEYVCYICFDLGIWPLHNHS